MHESVDGDDDAAREAHSWSEHEERDVYEEMEARGNIPSHGQSTKDFLPDVIRAGLCAEVRTLRVQQEDGAGQC